MQTVSHFARASAQLSNMLSDFCVMKTEPAGACMAATVFRSREHLNNTSSRELSDLRLAFSLHCKYVFC